jgi:hypothetical protein
MCVCIYIYIVLIYNLPFGIATVNLCRFRKDQNKGESVKRLQALLDRSCKTHRERNAGNAAAAAADCSSRERETWVDCMRRESWRRSIGVIGRNICTLSSFVAWSVTSDHWLLFIVACSHANTHACHPSTVLQIFTMSRFNIDIWSLSICRTYNELDQKFFFNYYTLLSLKYIILLYLYAWIQ